MRLDSWRALEFLTQHVAEMCSRGGNVFQPLELQMMMAAQGAVAQPDNSVEDCIDTMACVEAAYLSNEKGGVTLKEIRQQKYKSYFYSQP